MEECVRAISLMFSNSTSAAAIRVKFSKLREIMQVITSDSISTGTAFSSCTHISEIEYQHYLSIRKH
jgi:hypothetical protein